MRAREILTAMMLSRYTDRMETTDAKLWQVYLLECADGTYYCGISNDVPARISAHNAGTGARYTKGRAPVNMIACSPAMSRSDALKREHAVKQLGKAFKAAAVSAPL